MAEPNQYLRLELEGVNYLLPSTASFSIENRDDMIVNESPNGNISAWRAVKSRRWPAYCLDRDLKVTRRDNWQRAVFLEAIPNAVGIIVNEVQLLPRADVQVTPFTPLGTPPIQIGHLFSGASVYDGRLTLVFEPKTLIVYLQSLGE